MRKTVLIDCDPGQDDAIMLFLAFASKEQLDIAAITTVAGNVGLEQTQRNARIVCDLVEQFDTPVYAGLEAPLKRPLVTAEWVHGKSGIDGIEIIEPKTALQTQHAVDFLIEYLLSASKPVTVVCTGPLTNLAAAIEQDPQISSNIEELVIMGGALREGGNMTPSAEFNFYVDPDAAQIVIDCGCPITVTGLDVTHQALITPVMLEEIRGINSKPAKATVAMLEHYNRYNSEKFNNQGSPLHDPCALAYVIQPSLFTGKMCNLEIETKSELTLGHSAVDFWNATDKAKNVNWLHGIDARGFTDLMIKSLEGYV